MIELVCASDSSIDGLFDECLLKDIHYHPDYLRLFEDYTNNKAIYVHYKEKDNYLLIPFFVRQIDGFKDLISPWYYGGPISNHFYSQEMFKNFLTKFTKYCKENRIVSEFQRFNPITKNHILYDQASFNRKIVYVDLTNDMDTINYNYERHVKKNINKAFRSNLSIYRDESPKGIEIFKKLYKQSMKQKHAKPFYFFSDDFFENLFNMFKDEVYLFHVKYKDRVICSSLELGKYGILHDYLRGTDSKYLEFRPNDFLLDTVINWAKQERFKYFSLGGGNTTKEDDSQYKFKKSFSTNTAYFYVYKKIHNMEVYKQLCKGKDLKYESAQYFPEYMEE